MHVGHVTVTLAVSLIALCACTSAPVQSPGAVYPLPACRNEADRDCVAPFFADHQLIAARIPEAFPRRYLELWDAQVRASECQGDAICAKRLEQLDAYFNPRGKPDTGKIGVALEGGGNKSAPFSLGVLAGIDQMGLWDRVGAIASVSGGSYAASFYFNRMLDLYNGSSPPTPDEVKRMRDAWFSSCIPDAFSSARRQYFAHLKELEPHRCGELGNPDFAFAAKYRYQRQVWMHPDVLRIRNNVAGDADEALHLDDVGNLLALTGMTLVTVPYQFVARTIFRWPVNSSPSRFAYRLGLEREYGYSPDDWKRALANDTPIWWHTLHVRRGERTLTNLAQKVKDHAPNWIILSSAPGHIDALAWAKPSPRDPIRQQFEITPTGHGSGTYGYARASPGPPFDFFGASPNGLPIFDAVLASAAFFDDNQTLVSRQPARLLLGAGQQFANVDWYSEVRNFNVSDRERTIDRALAWPFYLLDTVKQSQTPYIHLQDGGNAENAGILPLLRRGYRRIVYAHGTTDVQAQFPAICHLKNQLEYDGNYYIVSRDLQDLVGDRDSGGTSPIPAGAFLNYLDQLCSQQIDASDLAAFDRNELREDGQRVRAVAKVLCGRIGRYATLGEVAYPKRAQPDPGYAPCPNYWRRLRYSMETGAQGELALTFPVRRGLFYQTSATPLRFHVCRGDALQLADAARAGREQAVEKPLSTIVTVVPAVGWNDVKAQIDPVPGGAQSDDWRALCAMPVDERRQINVRACQAPDSTRVPSAAPGATPPEELLPCGALAHVLEDKCKSIDQDGIAIRHPAFPQGDLVTLTLHIPYPTYAAYFDLGRAQVRRALGPVFAERIEDDDVRACAIPTALGDR